VALRLAEIAERLGARTVGDADRVLTAVANLREAGPDELSFLLSPRYRRDAEASRAGALLTGPWAEEILGPSAERGERSLLLVEDPELALNAALSLLHPVPRRAPGVHPTAVVEPGAEVAEDVFVGPFAVIGEGSELASGVEVHAHAVVGRGCRVGPGSVLYSHVVLYDGTVLGERVVVHAGTVLGADGFGYVSRPDGHHKVPQVGRAVIEDDVEIGALSAVDRAKVGATRIGEGSKIDNLVQVGHNVQIGRRSILCGQSGIAGSSRLGDGVVLAGQAGVGGHITLGDRVQVGAASAAVRPVPEGTVVSATVPAMEIGRWRRQAALLGRLEEMHRRLRALENRLEARDGAEEKEESLD
jgi:UDP-3-O-[3-hydroxymyristoyl] glucosamine N-acyltransferase